MKTFKIISITLVVSGGIFIAGSSYAALSFSSFTSTGSSVPQQSNVSKCLSVADQIAQGYKYDICTGQKLPIVSTVDPVEARFEAIEARLSKLEANK